MRKRFPLDYTPEKGFHVDLPHYSMVPGTWLPIVNGLIHADGCTPDCDPADAIAHQVSCLVDIPHDVILDGHQQIDTAKMRRRYPTDSQYGDKTYRPPRILGDR